MIKRISILFVSENNRLFNSEFDIYFSNIVASIILSSIKVRENKRTSKNGPSEKIFFIHNARFNKKINPQQEWGIKNIVTSFSNNGLFLFTEPE